MKNKKRGPSFNSKPSVPMTNAQQQQMNMNSQPVNNNVNSLFSNADQQRAANMGMQIPVQQMQMPVQQMQMQIPQMQQPINSINVTPNNVNVFGGQQVRNVSGGMYGARQVPYQAQHPPQEIVGFFNDDEALIEKAK